MDGCTFTGNQGNLAGAIMITSGALASIENSVFDSNATPNYGSFAGGIFHVRTLPISNESSPAYESRFIDS